MSFSDGPRPWPVSRWQVDAGQVVEQPGAALRQRALHAAALQPRLVVRRLQHDHVADHAGVVGAAVLGAEDVVRAGRLRLEPELGVAPGNRVHLGAERREVQAVKHVLGADRDLDRPARPGCAAR